MHFCPLANVRLNRIGRILACCLSGSAVLATSLVTQTAKAEGWDTNGVFALGTGVQGGDPGTGTVAWARARTRVIAGVDLRSDEAMTDGFGVYGFAEVERRATFGAEARYERWLTPTIGVHVGFLGTIAPQTMFGPGVGARLGLPIGKKATLFLEPGFAVFPVGSDLPKGNVILWGTLSGGIGVAL
jgi:hypothetical protein